VEPILDKPYVDASKAAALLGVTRSVVVADVIRGYEKMDSLTGVAHDGGVCVVDRKDLEGEWLEFHRKRLANHSSEVQP
jgi:hypothetical protein